MGPKAKTRSTGIKRKGINSYLRDNSCPYPLSRTRGIDIAARKGLPRISGKGLDGLETDIRKGAVKPR